MARGVGWMGAGKEARGRVTRGLGTESERLGAEGRGQWSSFEVKLVGRGRGGEVWNRHNLSDSYLLTHE